MAQQSEIESDLSSTDLIRRYSDAILRKISESITSEEYVAICRHVKDFKQFLINMNTKSSLSLVEVLNELDANMIKNFPDSLVGLVDPLDPLGLYFDPP
jgi:hypothetical protein